MSTCTYDNDCIVNDGDEMDSCDDGQSMADHSARHHRVKSKIGFELDFGHKKTNEDSQYQDSSVPSVDRELVGHTGFNPSDAPPGERQKWERLQKLNNGYGESDRSVQIHENGIRRDLDIISDRLGCTTYQKEKVEWYIDGLNINDEIGSSVSVEAAILGITSLVIDESRTKRARLTEDVTITSVLNDDIFVDLCSDFGVNRGVIRQVRISVRDTEVYEDRHN